MSLKWLEWAQQLQAIAQNGFTYCNNTYDLKPKGYFIPCPLDYPYCRDVGCNVSTVWVIDRT